MANILSRVSVNVAYNGLGVSRRPPIESTVFSPDAQLRQDRLDKRQASVEHEQHDYNRQGDDHQYFFVGVRLKRVAMALSKYYYELRAFAGITVSAPVAAADLNAKPCMSQAKIELATLGHIIEITGSASVLTDPIIR